MKTIWKHRKLDKTARLITRIIFVVNEITRVEFIYRFFSRQQKDNQNEHRRI
jgi:hypothetical protein